jgi:hypothetical protein
MTIPTKDERTEFWKNAYARASFVNARIFAEQILETKLPLDNPIRKALSIAFLTTYGRPFKQRKNIRLSDDIIPPEYVEEHNTAIELRDKVVAHRDLDGPVAEWGLVNQLEFTVDRKEIEVNTNSPVMLDDISRKLILLVDRLIEIMDSANGDFALKYFSELELKPGEYILRLDDDPKEWIAQIK